MLRSGAAGYILKDIHPAEFEIALGEVLREGFYLPGDVAAVVINAIADRARHTEVDYIGQPLKERELEFLHFACSELTYRQIAEKMILSSRTIDGYRDALFDKLGVRSRAGLVIYAMENGIKRYRQ